MLRWVVAASVVAGAGPAAAEDWRLMMDIQGSMPERTAGLIDYDSVDRSDPAFPRVKQALLFETARANDVKRVANTYVVDCAGMRLRIVHIEAWNSEGKIVVSQALDRPFDAIEAGSPADTVHLAVCDDTWLLTTETGKQSLDAIASGLFGG